MVIVAVLLLPVLGLLLFTMTYLEDRLLGDPEPPRHARRRHLRLIPGGRGAAPGAGRPGRAARHHPPGRHAA